MKNLKKSLVVFIFLLVFTSIFYYLPYYIVSNKKIDFSNIVLSSIAYKETQNKTKELDKAISIYSYIHKHIKKPENSKIYYTNILGQSCKYLLAQKAYCDNQCNELLEIAYHANIYGRLLFLFGKDSISKHAVCELKVDNKFIMFDPYFGIVLQNNSKILLGIKEICAGNVIFPNTFFRNKIEKYKYQCLYKMKYPYVIVKNNQLFKTAEEKRMISIYKFWYSVFGESNRKRLFTYYYKINKVIKEDQRRINQLFD
jgi:hypothetical protein